MPRRLSLRCAALGLAVISCLLGSLSWKARRQRALVEWVRARGGTVGYRYEWNEANGSLVDATPPFPTWLRNLVGIDFLDSVVFVDVSYTTGGRFDLLATVTSIRCVDVSGSDIDDLSPVALLPKLTRLRFRGTTVGRIPPLASRTHLREIDLSETRVSDISNLSSCCHLESLCASRSHITDVAPIRELAGIRFLALEDTPVESLAPIRSMSGIESLYIGGTQIRDISAVSSLERLRVLSIAGLNVVSIRPVLTCHRLQYLDFFPSDPADWAQYGPDIDLIRRAFPTSELFIPIPYVAPKPERNAPLGGDPDFSRSPDAIDKALKK